LPNGVAQRPKPVRCSPISPCGLLAMAIRRPMRLTMRLTMAIDAIDPNVGAELRGAVIAPHI